MAISKKLLEEAQAVMDMYYQDFAPDDAFLRVEDFAIWLGKAYGKVADDVAKEIYKTSLAEMGTGMIIFPQEWWAKTEYEVKEENSKLFAEIDFQSVGFTYDMQNSGIQELMIEEGGGNPIRTTLTDLWVLNGMSKSKLIYWYLDMNKIRFKFNSDCKPKKISVYYIPTADDKNFKVPQSKSYDIAALAFNLMLSAKKETPIVDTTNNSNPNITQPTEADSKTIKPAGT